MENTINTCQHNHDRFLIIDNVVYLFGALFFREKNLKAKAFDLALVLLGMIFLYIGSK